MIVERSGKYLTMLSRVGIEIPHPAIYANHGCGILNREYSPGNKEERIERFGTHALHILQALEDVAVTGHQAEVAKIIKKWRTVSLAQRGEI